MKLFILNGNAYDVTRSDGMYKLAKKLGVEDAQFVVSNAHDWCEANNKTVAKANFKKTNKGREIKFL